MATNKYLLDRSPFAQRERSRKRLGITVVYAILALTALCGFCSLGAEYARVQLTKVELERASDSAARAGACALPIGGASAAQSAAITYAGYQTADGAAVTLVAADVEIGRYISGTFTINASPSNAVRVTASRTAAKGNAVSLNFARILGISSCDVKAVSISTGTARPFGGLIGLTGVNIKNNLTISSYNSAILTNPSSGSANSNALVGSNSSISVGMNGVLKGDVVLGPSGSTSGSFTISGTIVHQSTPITSPTMPAWTPGSNPGAVPQIYAVNSTTTLAGGTYWFTSLTINSSLSFSGNTIIYVNGDVDLSGSLTAYNSIPGNLVIYQLGSSRVFGNSGGNNMDITADIIAPGADFASKNNLTLRGSGFFNSIDIKNNADIYYDESLGNARNGVIVVQVK